MFNWIQSAVTGLLLERPAQKLTFEQHAETLSQNGEALAYRFAACDDSPANREQLRHIIGIERWGQARLRAFLSGQTDLDTLDEYDGYRPDDALDWAALQAAFTAARVDSVALARELAGRDLDPSMTVIHNQYGRLSAYGWLRYLDTHANLEGKRVR